MRMLLWWPAALREKKRNFAVRFHSRNRLSVIYCFRFSSNHLSITKRIIVCLTLSYITQIKRSDLFPVSEEFLDTLKQYTKLTYFYSDWFNIWELEQQQFMQHSSVCATFQNIDFLAMEALKVTAKSRRQLQTNTLAHWSYAAAVFTIVGWLIDWLIDWLDDWQTDKLVVGDWLTDWLTVVKWNSAQSHTKHASTGTRRTSNMCTYSVSIA